MRIIYVTDIHGSFNELTILLQETVADLYIIGGDLIDIPFYSMDTAITYHELQNFFHGLRRAQGRMNIIIEDLVDELLDDPDTSDEIHEKGMKYQHYTIRARRVMQQKYKVLENILSSKSNSLVLALPGNYDMDLKYTSLHERDLHLHRYYIDNVCIAGYGGADIFTAGIPERYIIRYRAGIGTQDKANEMYQYFKAARPDIIVSHQPAHGINDRISYKGPSGSPALRTYCNSRRVPLCLTGHIHEAWGMVYNEGTVYLNPSNFGELITTTGEVSEGGFFYQIEMDGARPSEIIFRKLAGNRVHDIADYFNVGDSWAEKIIDPERYMALERRENYDMKIKKYSHIPEIVLFNEIRQFFRSFQTRETDERIGIMEDVARLLENMTDGIAMDLLGSVNIGLSGSESDIDMVLYLRCENPCREMTSICPALSRVRELIQEKLEGICHFQIIDCVDLNLVEKSIMERDYESETLQRFVAHRSMGRPINYRVIAPVEDLLNSDMEFRKEIEGSIQAFFKIFTNTSQHVKSFEKYELRLKTLGIHIPEAIRDKIKQYFRLSSEDNISLK